MAINNFLGNRHVVVIPTNPRTATNNPRVVAAFTMTSDRSKQERTVEEANNSLVELHARPPD